MLSYIRNRGIFVLFRVIEKSLSVYVLGTLWIQYININDRLTLKYYVYPIAGIVFLTYSWFPYMEYQEIRDYEERDMVAEWNIIDRYLSNIITSILYLLLWIGYRFI